MVVCYPVLLDYRTFSRFLIPISGYPNKIYAKQTLNVFYVNISLPMLFVMCMLGSNVCELYVMK